MTVKQPGGDAGELMDPKTTQLYLSFGGEKEEEHVSVLIAKGLPTHPEH